MTAQRSPRTGTASPGQPDTLGSRPDRRRGGGQRRSRVARPLHDRVPSRVDALVNSADAITARLESLTEQLAVVTARLDDLLEGVVSATAPGAPNRNELARENDITPGSSRLPTIVLPGAAFSAPTRRVRYQQVVERIRDTIRETLTGDASVVVISKGDEDLLRLGSVRASHFPQTGNGMYAGYHPADSAAAISDLEMVRAKGASYLVVPSTAYWWFSHYREFREHLETRYHAIIENKDCTIYDLSGRAAEAVERPIGRSSQSAERRTQ